MTDGTPDAHRYRYNLVHRNPNLETPIDTPITDNHKKNINNPHQRSGMQNYDAQDIIGQAIQRVADMSPQQTDGKWLEELTVLVSPHIPDWEHIAAYPWNEWPEREKYFPGTTNQDIGIDVVAKRNDGQYIAIQCKSRQLDEYGHGADITNNEITKFASASAGSFLERTLDRNQRRQPRPPETSGKSSPCTTSPSRW